MTQIRRISHGDWKHSATKLLTRQHQGPWLQPSSAQPQQSRQDQTGSPFISRKRHSQSGWFHISIKLTYKDEKKWKLCGPRYSTGNFSLLQFSEQERNIGRNIFGDDWFIFKLSIWIVCGTIVSSSLFGYRKCLGYLTRPHENVAFCRLLSV